MREIRIINLTKFQSIFYSFLFFSFLFLEPQLHQYFPHSGSEQIISPLNLESTACIVGHVRLLECKLFSLKPLEDCDDGDIDVLPLTGEPNRKQKHDKDPRRHRLMCKPRIKQKDVHSLTLSTEVGTKTESEQEQSMDCEKKNEITNHRTKPCFIL